MRQFHLWFDNQAHVKRKQNECNTRTTLYNGIYIVDNKILNIVQKLLMNPAMVMVSKGKGKVPEIVHLYFKKK